MTLYQFQELIMEINPLTLTYLPTFIKLDPKWSLWKQKHYGKKIFLGTCWYSWIGHSDIQSVQTHKKKVFVFSQKKKDKLFNSQKKNPARYNGTVHITPALGKLRQENCCEFKASLSYIMNVNPTGLQNDNLFYQQKWACLENQYLN